MLAAAAVALWMGAAGALAGDAVATALDFSSLRPSPELSLSDLKAAVQLEDADISRHDDGRHDDCRTWLVCGNHAALFAARDSLGKARVKPVSNRRAQREACFLCFTTEEAVRQLDAKGVTQAVPVPAAYKVQPGLIRYHGAEGAEDAEIVDLTHLVVEVRFVCCIFFFLFQTRQTYRPQTSGVCYCAHTAPHTPCSRYGRSRTMRTRTNTSFTKRFVVGSRGFTCSPVTEGTRTTMTVGRRSDPRMQRTGGRGSGGVRVAAAPSVHSRGVSPSRCIPLVKRQRAPS